MDTNLTAMLITAFSLGLVGSGHCLGMCGGIVVSLNSATGSDANTPASWRSVGSQMVFNAGRITSYALIGLLAAGSVGVVAAMTPYGPALRVLAALMTIAIGLSIANWWQGIAALEALGSKLWRFIQPLTQRFLPPKTPLQVLMLGLLWGWLPCGLVYTALSYALLSGDALAGFTVMLAFGAGTLPALLLVGSLSQSVQQHLKSRWGRRIAGVLVILLGVYMLNNAVFSNHQRHANAHQPAIMAPDQSRHEH